MTSKERFLRLIGATNQNPYYFLNHNYDSNQWYKDKNIIEQDLETLEMLLSCFKSNILEATSNGYRRGDNIIADLLRDKLGLIKLNELKRRLENDK